MKKYCLLCYFIVLILFNGYSQNFVKINPDTVTQGQYVKIAIYGTNTNFKSITTANVVVLMRNYDERIYADSLDIKNDTFMYGFFQIPYSFSGSFDLVFDITPVLSLTKALFIKQGTIVPVITHIQPDSVYQGTYFTFRIYGKNTHFTKCSYFNVWLVQFYDDGVTVLNDTVVEVLKNIPMSVNPGLYGIMIKNSRDGEITKNNILRVVKSPTAPVIVDISPDSMQQGTTTKTLITTRNTFFTTSGVKNITLYQDKYGIHSKSIQVINDTALYADFSTVLTCPLGYFDLELMPDTTNTRLWLYKCFKIYPTEIKPKLVSVSPDSAIQGSNITVYIKGTNTHFTYLNMKPGASLRSGSYNYKTFSTNVINDSLLSCNFPIPLTATLGFYDIGVYDSMDGQMILKKVFKVLVKPNPPTIILALPDTMFQGEYYNMKVFCRNTNFNSSSSMYIGYTFPKEIGRHFEPKPRYTINDSTVFGKIVSNQFQDNPIGSYNLEIANLINGQFIQEASLFLIAGKLMPQIIKVNPDKILAGTTYSLEITGKNSKFTDASFQDIKIVAYSKTLIPTTFKVENDTLIKATFIFPVGFQLGWAEIAVRDSGDNILTFPIEIILPKNYPQIVSVTPNFLKTGDDRTIIIHTKNTFLTQSPTYQRILLIRNFANDTIFGTNYKVLNDTTASVEIQTTASLTPGDFDVLLWGSSMGNMRFYKGLKFTRFSGFAKILQINPDSAFINNKVQVIISCSGTKFSKDVIIFPVFTSHSGKELYADSIKMINDSTLFAWLSIPSDAETGFWDLTLLTDQEGDFHLKGKFKIRSDVSINEITNSSINVYPNPFSDFIKIQSETSIKQIVLYDLTGKVIFNENLNTSNQCYINTNNLDSGIYVLKIIDENKVVLKKMVKK